MKTWLFWDWWQVEHQDNAEIRQGHPEWVPEATYTDPTLGFLGHWPQVWREKGGRFRMLYSGSGFPLTILAAESPDGIHWQPSNYPDVHPAGKKFAPNHLFTVENANGGPIVRDLRDPDNPRFLVCLSHRGGRRAQKGTVEKNAAFHELVTSPGAKSYGGLNRMAISEDGVHWNLDPGGAAFNLPGWFPEAPFWPFYSEALSQYVLVTRHGWGDRRMAGCLSDDGLNWSRPFHLLQPDPEDSPQLQFYGMPVHRYEGWYVGFLWTGHFSNAERLGRWNQISGTVDSQLTYSPDGRAFQRFLREPFLPLQEPGEPGGAVIYPSCMIEDGEELLIYSSATPELHHQRANHSQFERSGTGVHNILLHKLRKDGFAYIASQGDWATVQTKPMLLEEPRFELNVLGPYGEALFQVCDAVSAPLAGFSFEDCVPFSGGDELRFPLRWKNADLSQLAGQAVRLEFKFRNLRIYALRGSFHFADALDLARAKDGQALETGPFDY